MSDNLLSSTDAMVWAKEFCQTFAGMTVMPNAGVANMLDEGTMVGWFANAIMRGYDEGRKATCPHAPEDVSVLADDLTCCTKCGTLFEAPVRAPGEQSGG